MDEIREIIKENARRNRLLATEYDPIKGIGCCGERCRVAAAAYNDGEAFVPVAMVKDEKYNTVWEHEDWVKLRCRYDFEYWCATCVEIKDKTTGRDTRFILNAPQRRLVALLEKDRLAGRPMRIIMLKARQWGGSTVVQVYMAWLQCVICRNWHSLICAHVKDTAASIRGMYSKLLSSYPKEYWDGDGEEPKFKPFERSANIREIVGRNCRVTVGSSENQDAVRGSDYAMAHLSEIAFWSDTSQRSPDKFIRAVCGAIALVPNSLIVMESTANGVGNFFHREWLRAKAGESDKTPVMVPWHEIEIYRAAVAAPERLWRDMDEYERNLWHKGLTLEMIQWYHLKRKEYPSQSMMQAEYPSDDIEAFANSGHGVFSLEAIERLRRGCSEPAQKGDLTARSQKGEKSLAELRFTPDERGCLSVWSPPSPPTAGSLNDRYVVTVDIGGRSAGSDFSVISVFDRQPLIEGRGIEVVAQWRGHLDHDLLAWRSAMIATWYNDALLVIESNTLETENTEGEHGLSLLAQLNNVYPNLYRREAFDSVTSAVQTRVGFHTNRATKALVVNTLIGLVRDGGYVERSATACDEMATYEQKPNGAFGAKAGCHDDVLMTRAIGLYVASSLDASTMANIPPLQKEW